MINNLKTLLIMVLIIIAIVLNLQLGFKQKKIDKLSCQDSVSDTISDTVSDTASLPDNLKTQVIIEREKIICKKRVRDIVTNCSRVNASRVPDPRVTDPRVPDSRVGVTDTSANGIKDQRVTDSKVYASRVTDSRVGVTDPNDPRVRVCDPDPHDKITTEIRYFPPEAKAKINTDSDGNTKIIIKNKGLCFEPCILGIITSRGIKVGVGARLAYWRRYGISVGVNCLFSDSNNMTLTPYVAIDRRISDIIPFMKNTTVGIVYEGLRPQDQRQCLRHGDFGIVLSVFF